MESSTSRDIAGISVLVRELIFFVPKMVVKEQYFTHFSVMVEKYRSDFSSAFYRLSDVFFNLVLRADVPNILTIEKENRWEKRLPFEENRKSICMIICMPDLAFLKCFSPEGGTGFSFSIWFIRSTWSALVFC